MVCYNQINKVKESRGKRMAKEKVYCKECGIELDVQKAYREKVYTRGNQSRTGQVEGLFTMAIDCECGKKNCVQIDTEETLTVLKNIIAVIGKLKKEKRSTEKSKHINDLHRLDRVLMEKRKSLEKQYSNMIVTNENGDAINLEVVQVERSSESFM